MSKVFTISERDRPLGPRLGLCNLSFLRCQLGVETSSELSFPVCPGVEHLCWVLYTKLKYKLTGASAQGNTEWHGLERCWHTEMGGEGHWSPTVQGEFFQFQRKGLRTGMGKKGPPIGGMA